MIAKVKYKAGIWTGCLLLLLMMSGIRIAYAQTKPPLEYQVKAAFLFNFTHFIHWPASAYAAPDAPFVIGIAGNDPFGTYLDDLVNGEMTDGHKIIVRRYPDGGDISGCQLVFINMGDLTKLKAVLSQAAHQSILTVSDADDFIKIGGILHFYTDNNRVKMEIRLAGAKAAQLEISAKLLQVAKIK